eukprot:4815227-Pleurochrysis_carterae.AAC.1
MVLACCCAEAHRCKLCIGLCPVDVENAKMKGSPQVQILAHRDKKQLCLVDATEPTHELSSVNCTTERRKSPKHRQLSRSSRIQ